MPSTCVNKCINAIGKDFWRPVFNVSMYIEFQIFFSIAKYSNARFSLCETLHEFVHGFCFFTKVHFKQYGPQKKD